MIREGATVMNTKEQGDRGRRMRGFTLLEVLVSLTLLTIILGAVYTSLFTVHSAIERFDDISLKYHEIRTALDIMRREIEGAFLPEPRTNFIIEDRDIFGRTASRLYLTAFSFRSSGLKTISYYVDEREGRLNLVKKESSAFRTLILSTSFTPLIANAQAENLTDRIYTTEVVEEIEGFTVETLFNNKWVKTWDAKQTGNLPEVIRVSIELDDKGKKVKLTEYARPKIGRQL